MACHWINLIYGHWKKRPANEIVTVKCHSVFEMCCKIVFECHQKKRTSEDKSTNLKCISNFYNSTPPKKAYSNQRGLFPFIAIFHDSIQQHLSE